jgi:hypothetical protein
LGRLWELPRAATTAIHGLLGVALILLLASCGGSKTADAQEAVRQLDGVQDVQECEDTGQTDLNSTNGDKLPVYLCAVQVSTKSVASPLEREVGLDEGSEYVERCYTVGYRDGEPAAFVTVDRLPGCPALTRTDPFG